MSRYDLSGEVFGRLTVLRDSGKRSSQGNVIYVCRCACGTECEAMTAALKAGSKKSCGCLHLDSARAQGKNVKHGMHGSRTYKSWMAMRHRCISPSDTSYPFYGGRGIQVCDRWLNSFEYFLEDMGTRPVGTSIERTESNGNYEPGNCRWASPKEQANNRKSSRWVNHLGSVITLSAYAEAVGMSHSGAKKRAIREGLLHAKR